MHESLFCHRVSPLAPYRGSTPGLLKSAYSIKHLRATFSQRSHGVQKKCRTPRCAQYDRKHRRSNAVVHVSPIDAFRSYRTPNDGAHFKNAKGPTFYFDWNVKHQIKQCTPQPPFPQQYEFSTNKKSKLSLLTVID